jgi:hypothetical protein
MVQHRATVSQQHQGQGPQVISIDWTFAHHERSDQIYGVKRSYDYVEKRMSRYQTVMTAAVANRRRVDGLAVALGRPEGYLSRITEVAREVAKGNPLSEKATAAMQRDLECVANPLTLKGKTPTPYRTYQASSLGLDR